MKTRVADPDPGILVGLDLFFKCSNPDPGLLEGTPGTGFSQ